MSNKVFNVKEEDIKSLCDFMGIKPNGRNSYSWSDGVYFSTYDESWEKVMDSICRYIGERKVMDWNWLMEIVDKIESIADYIVVVICGNVCKIEGLTDQFIIGTGDSKTEAVYNCCVSFVKWYNSKNSSNERV